jgi:hypothetical protein
VGIFARNKEMAVQSFVLKLVNNNCSELDSLMDGPRSEARVNLVMVVYVVPLQQNQPMLEQAFTTVTKEFSTTGVALVLDEPRGLDEVLLGFRWDGQMTWLRAKAKHLSPMGGGFHQLGFRMTEVIHSSDCRELNALTV